MKTSDALNRAAEIVIERGHTKGTFEDAAGHVCAEGALSHAVAEMRPFGLLDWQVARGYLRRVLGGDVPMWNDRPETTGAMVIDALHEAALLAKADEE